MASKVRNLAALVDRQLPDFITTEYPKFSEFLQKYYEQLELPGQPLDLINNLFKYRNIDTYDKKILTESCTLASNVEDTDNLIEVDSTVGFPSVNGYIQIEDEIIFYQEKTDTSFIGCYRNVSGTTTLGDLYNSSTVSNISYAELGSGFFHNSGREVRNISNLFLYALVKNFESEYLGNFPEKDLRPSVDKRTLIKNIKRFYSAKGTDQSIRFLFNSIVTDDPTNVPTVYYPKDSTYKASVGDWIDKYSLKVKVLSGDISKIIGERIVQEVDVQDPSVKSAFAIVDNIIDVGDDFYELVLGEGTVVGNFSVAAQTFLTKTLTFSASENKRINVYSTEGWDYTTGTILIGSETIQYKDKNVSQFVIKSRGSSPISYGVNTPVYNNSTVSVTYTDDNGDPQVVKILILGILYKLSPNIIQPYSTKGDVIQISKSGFDTRETIIYDRNEERIRWSINETNVAPTSSNTSLLTNINECIADVSAIYEDNQYYYIASSGFPSHDFGLASWNVNLKDQKNLKLIRKSPSRTTEIYETPINEIGVLVNGVTIRSYKDEEQVVFGEITKINVTKQGSGYVNPPKVLIYNAAREEVAQAYAILAGEVVEEIRVTESGSGFFPPVPFIEVTSGRNAVVEARVTGDRVTSLKIINPGEYYTSPPRIIIRDKLGQGRFASYKAIISNDGELVDFIKEDEGKFYTQKNIEVIVESVGNGAEGETIVRTWRKNKLEKYKNSLDFSNGLYFLNNDPAREYGYSYLANPKSLRVELGDNLSALGVVPPTLTHSPLLGYAFDGNPIYGPYGFTDPIDPNTPIKRMLSSFVLKANRPLGPSAIEYPLGSFIEDFEYRHRSGDLDENNGRFCITPEYPNGTYAYFTTIDNQNNPVFPYIIGKNYYSIPVDSNYNRTISQDDLPIKVSRLRTSLGFENGEGVFAFIDDVSSGSVSDVIVESSPSTFSSGCVVDVDYAGTEGSGILAKVSSIKGKQVDSIESKETKALKVITEDSAYFFKNSIITQENTGATGELIGDVFDDKTLVLRNVQGTFNSLDTLSSTIPVINIITDTPATFTGGKEIVLTTGNQIVIIKVENDRLFVASNTFKNNEPITFTNSFGGIVQNQIYYVVQGAATYFYIANEPNGSPIDIPNITSPGAVASSERGRGLILQTAEFKNTLKIQVLQGSFDSSINIGEAEEVEDQYFLRSFSASDSVGVRVNTILNLSSGIKPFQIVDNIAIVETDEDHNISLNDKVVIDINPNDVETETTIYVRKRIYQKVKLTTPVYNKKIKDTGLGRFRLLNSGSDYASQTSGNKTYTNVELIFADQSLCRDDQGRIVGNKSSASIGKAGNANNARATIITTGGLVSSITITSKGKNYKRGDLLTASATTLERGVTTSTRFFIGEVEHVGFGSNESKLYLDSVTFISENDLLQIGNEILKVTSINSNDSYVNVLRGQNNTPLIDHFDGQAVNSYNETYRFDEGYVVGFGDSEGIVDSYDPESQELTLVYTLGKTIPQINSVFAGRTFFDESTPRKLVTVKDSIESTAYKFEFSYDNLVWERNPVIKIQNYYRYKFDTSHITLTGSFLDFSPSGNFNIITTEVTRSTIFPGFAGSFTSIKLGFGSAIDSNTYTTKIPVEFTNYFYYDKNGIVDSDKSYLRLVPDPLQGEKIVTYVTPTKFVYEMGSDVPEYDGSGTISYTTNSILATGEIDKIEISNQGKELLQLPTVYGVRPAAINECVVDVNWSSISQNIVSVIIQSPGKNYVNPKIVILSSTGSGAEFKILKNSDGSIASIVTVNRGSGYKTKPDIKIVESSVKCYFASKNIGLVKSVSLNVNGKNFSKDNTISKQFTGSQILVLKNIGESSSFIAGERIEQYDDNSLSFGYVVSSGYKEGTNTLKLEKVEGQFKPGLEIRGKLGNKTAIVVDTFATIFTPDVRSYYDNLGYYLSDKSKLSSASQKLADSYLQQDYSYVVKSKTPINQWRDLVKDTVHPSGFKLFGEVSVESTGSAELPPSNLQPKEDRVSIIQLWDPERNKITVENTYRTVTQSTIRVKDSNVIRGRGSVFSPAYDTGETSSYEFYLFPDFDGFINENGNPEGNTVFTIKLRGSNNVFSVSNENNVILSLDGVLQEPGVSYTVNGSQLTFSKPPLGYRNQFGESIPKSSYIEGVDSPSQKLVTRIIKFKDETLNQNYFRKIKDISSLFNGTTKEFDLYYMDDTPVELDENENLMVSLDGVPQLTGSTPLLPADRAYYIRRTVTPNKLVFLEAPTVYENFRQKFFAVTVGSFERIKIDSRFVDDSYKGPFLLRSSLTDKIIGVDDDRNVLVFVDGVLQKRNRDYVLRGSGITFTESVLIGQKINIIYLYGRDFFKSLTAFNYERVKYVNRSKIIVSGEVLGNVGDGVTIYSLSTTGTVKLKYFDGTNTYITIESQNKRFTTNEDLLFRSASGTTFTIPSNRIVSIEEFEEDSDTGEDILVKSVPGWMIGYADTLSRKDNYINIGDLIKVDGEEDFRTITSISTTGRKTNYRDQDDVNEGYYGKLGTNNYSGLSRGEGLNVIAEIEDGKVVSLLWNKKDWNSYEIKKIFPSAPGYGYETAPQLIFVPQPVRDEGGTILASPTGGGAKAYVVVSNGEVVDVVLYDQGSGYLTEPKVVVSRGYYLVRQKKIEVSQVLLGLNAFLDGTTLTITSGSFTTEPEPPLIIITSFAVTTPVSSDRYITATIQTIQSSRQSSQLADYQHTSTIQVGANITSLSVASLVFQSSIETPIAIASQNNVSIISTPKEIVSTLRTFSKINTLLAYRSLHETGAYLDSFMTPTSKTAFVPTTERFLSSGKLLIEDEIVSYTSKLSDRFIGLIRGEDGTTAKEHLPGSFLRQYREDVTVIDVGVSSAEVIITVESSSVTVTSTSTLITTELQRIVNPDIKGITKEITTIRQQKEQVAVVSIIDAGVKPEVKTEITSDISYIPVIISVAPARLTSSIQLIRQSNSIVSVSKEIAKVVPAGFVDYYIENILLTDEVIGRTTTYTLTDPINYISLRNGSYIYAENRSQNLDLLGYERTNVGNILSGYNEWSYLSSGSSGVSGLTLGDIEHLFAAFDIGDFESSSQYAQSGRVWNYTLPSISEFGTFLTSDMNLVATTLNVSSTTGFPSSGKILIGNEVIQYTNKTTTSFTGVTRLYNVSTHTTGDYVRTFN
jgi:hypothetical protein